jgi:alkylation response protein AidB-like acyl-CoA dehydrogenase
LTDGKKENESYFEEKLRYVANFKKVALICIQAAQAQFGRKLGKEQEVMINIADIISELYIAESLALRVKKLESMKGEGANLHKDILDIFVFDTATIVRKNAIDLIYSLPQDEEKIKLEGAINRLTSVAGVNVKDARRRIAAKLIEDNDYRF